MKEKIIFTNKKILKFKSDSALISKTNQSNKMKSYIFNRESYAIRSSLVAQTIANREIKSTLIPYLINGPNLRAWQRQNKLFRYKKNNKRHYRKLKYFKRNNARIVRAWIRRFKYNRKKLLSKNKTKFKIYSHRRARTKLSRKYRGLRTRTFWYKKKRGKRVPYNLVLLRFITKLKTITTPCLIQKQALNKNNNKFFLALKKLAKQKINPRTLRANRTRFKRKLKKKQSSSKLKTKISIKWVKKLQNQIYAYLRNRRVSSVTLQNAIYVHVKNKSVAQKIDVKYLKKSKFNMKWFARSIIFSIVKAKLKFKRLKKIYSKKFSKSFQKKKEIAKKKYIQKRKIKLIISAKKKFKKKRLRKLKKRISKYNIRKNNKKHNKYNNKKNKQNKNKKKIIKRKQKQKIELKLSDKMSKRKRKYLIRIHAKRLARKKLLKKNFRRRQRRRRRWKKILNKINKKKYKKLHYKNKRRRKRYMLRLPGFAWYEHVRRIRQRNFEKKLKKIRTKKYRSHKQRRLYKKSKPIRYERQKTNREFIKDRLFIDILRKEFRVSETNLPTKPNSTLRYIRTRVIKRVLKNLQKKNKFFFNFLLEDREISGARTETDTVLLRSYWDAARVEQIRTTINNNFFQRQSWRQVSEAAIPYFVSNKIHRIFGYTSSLGYQRIQRAHILDFDQQHKIQQYSLFPNLTNSPYSNYDLKTFFKQNWNKFLLYDFDKVSLHMEQVLSIANLSVYNDVWHKLASLSGKTASEHKYLFVLGAQTWLKTRLIEKFIATWCVNQKFSEKIKTDIIKNSRIMLFTKTPDWFIVQARQRLFILSQTVSLPNQNYIFLRKEYQKKITVSQIVDLLDSWKIKPYKQEKLFLNFHKFIFARIEGIAQYFGRTNETIFATQNQLNKILPMNKPRFHYISYHDSTYESGVFAHVARLTGETYQKFTTQKFIAPTIYNKHEFTNALSDKKRLKERYAQYLTKQERTALDNKQNNIIQKKRFNSVPKNSLKNSSDLLSNIGAGTRLLLSKIIQHTNARQLNNHIYSSFLQKHMERASKKETIFEKEKWEDAEPRINVMLPLFEKQRQAEANDSEDYEEKYTLSPQIWTVEDFQAVFPVKINENTHTYRPISQHIFDLFFRENYKKSDLIFSNTDVLSKPSLMKKIPVYKEMENYRVDANLESHYKLDSNLIFDLEDKYSSFVAKTQNENYDLQTHSQAMIRAQYKNFKHFIKNKNKKYLNLKKPTLFSWHKIGFSKKRKILIAYARKKFLRIAKTFQKNKKVHLSPNIYSSQFLIKRIPARKARTAHYHLQLKSNIKRQISARRYLKRKLRIKKTTIKKLDNLKKKKFFAKKNKKVNFLLPNCVLNAGNNKLLPELAFSTKTNSYNKNKITSSDIKKFNLFSTKNKDHIILNPNKRLLPLRTSKKKKLKEVPNASYKTNIFSRLNKKIRNLRKINLEQIGYKSNNKLFNNRYLKAAQNNFFYKPNYKNMIFVSDSNAIQQQNYNKLQQCNIVQKAQTFRRMYRGKISNQAQFRIKYNQTKRKQKVISQVKRATLLYNKIFNISQKRTAISALTPLPLNFTQKKITKVIKTKQKKIKTSQNLISEKYQITLFVTNKINKIFVDTISNLFRFVYRNKVLPINVNGFVWATYWNLRIFMGQGGDISFKFNNLENEAVKQKLKEEINKESKKINVKHSTIKDLLFQTQPSRFIPRKIEQNDAGVDWLRTYFPKRYSIFAEDPEEQNHLRWSESEIYAKQPSNKIVLKWKHLPVYSNLYEHQKLLMTGPKENYRFENILATKKMHVYKNNNIIKTNNNLRVNFFSRKFSSLQRSNKFQHLFADTFFGLENKITNQENGLVSDLESTVANTYIQRERSPKNTFYLVKGVENIHALLHLRKIERNCKSLPLTSNIFFNHFKKIKLTDSDYRPKIISENVVSTKTYFFNFFQSDKKKTKFIWKHTRQHLPNRSKFFLNLFRTKKLMHNLKSIKKNTNTLINLGSHTNTIREKNLKQYVLLQKLKLKNSKRIKICRKKINKISFYKKQQTSLKKYIKKWKNEKKRIYVEKLYKNKQSWKKFTVFGKKHRLINQNTILDIKNKKKSNMNDELKITKKPFSTINNFFRTVRKERVSHNNVNYRKKQKKTKSRWTKQLRYWLRCRRLLRRETHTKNCDTIWQNFIYRVKKFRFFFNKFQKPLLKNEKSNKNKYLEPKRFIFKNKNFYLLKKLRVKKELILNANRNSPKNYLKKIKISFQNQKINKYKHVRIKIIERGARKRNFLYRIKVRLIRHSFKQYQKRLCTYIQKAKKIKINTFQNSSKKLKIKNNNLYFRRKMQWLFLKMSDKKIKKHPLTHRQLKNKLSNHKTLHKITKNKKFYSLKKLNNTSKRLLLTRIKKKRKKLRLVKKVGYKKINRIILNIPSNQRQSLKKITHTNKLLKRVNKSKKSIIFSYLFKNKVRKNQLIRRKKRRKFKWKTKYKLCTYREWKRYSLKKKLNFIVKFKKKIKLKKQREKKKVLKSKNKKRNKKTVLFRIFKKKKKKKRNFCFKIWHKKKIKKLKKKKLRWKKRIKLRWWQIDKLKKIKKERKRKKIRTFHLKRFKRKEKKLKRKNRSVYKIKSKLRSKKKLFENNKFLFQKQFWLKKQKLSKIKYARRKKYEISKYLSNAATNNNEILKNTQKFINKIRTKNRIAKLQNKIKNRLALNNILLKISIKKIKQFTFFRKLIFFTKKNKNFIQIISSKKLQNIIRTLPKIQLKYFLFWYKKYFTYYRSNIKLKYWLFKVTDIWNKNKYERRYFWFKKIAKNNNKLKSNTNKNIKIINLFLNLHKKIDFSKEIRNQQKKVLFRRHQNSVKLFKNPKLAIINNRTSNYWSKWKLYKNRCSKRSKRKYIYRNQKNKNKLILKSNQNKKIQNTKFHYKKKKEMSRSRKQYLIKKKKKKKLSKKLNHKYIKLRKLRLLNFKKQYKQKYTHRKWFKKLKQKNILFFYKSEHFKKQFQKSKVLKFKNIKINTTNNVRNAQLRLKQQNFILEKMKSANDFNFLRNFEPLWEDITSAENKKKHVFKNWIKEVGYLLKKEKWLHVASPKFNRIRLRIKKLYWSEIDEQAKRKGYRWYTFLPKQKRILEWLEPIVYPQKTFRTQTHVRKKNRARIDTKKFKWISRYIRVFAPSRQQQDSFIKGSARRKKNRGIKKWSRISTSNYKIHNSMFDLRDVGVAQKHFRKISRHQTNSERFANILRGYGNRLDVTLMLMRLAPTPFWARIVAKLKLIKVNNVSVDKNYMFKPGDIIDFNWPKIEELQKIMTIERQKNLDDFGGNLFSLKSYDNMSKNIKFLPKLKKAIYQRLPNVNDLEKNSRLNPVMYELFKMNAGTNRRR